jgi:serine protease AprX
VAAGVNLLGEMPSDSLIGQQFPDARQGNGLFRGSGTSQSTAVVSGVAALYLQSHKWAGPSQVKAAIRDAASGIPGAKTDGQGLVSIPSGASYSPFGTGESSLNLVQWYSTVSVWGPFWTTDAWDTRHWTAKHWTVDVWDTRHWTSDAWSAKHWTAKHWTAKHWASDAWDCRHWTAAIWGDPS